MRYKNKIKNNKNNLITTEVNRHYSIRKFSVGVASVLIGSTLFLGSQGQKVQAATDNNKPAVTEEKTQSTSDGDSFGSKSDTASKPEQTPAVTSNEKKDSNVTDTSTSVVNKPTNEQVSTSAQDDAAQEELTGDTNASGNRDKQQLSHKATSLNTDSNEFELTSTIANNTDHDDKNIFAVTVLPNTQDGKSQFDTHLTGPVQVEGKENAENVTNWYVTGDAGKSLDKLLTKDSEGNYEPTKGALESATIESYFKVKKWTQDDWDKVTAVITTVDSLKSKSSLKIHLHTYDPSVETDVNKSAYMSQVVMDSTSFKKLRTGRTINLFTDDGKLRGTQSKSLNDIAIYHTNAVTGDMVGDAVLEKGLPEFDIPTFDGYNVKSISGGNNEFWEDYDPDNPTKIFPVTVIKNLQDAKVSTRTGYAQIPNYTITVVYEKTEDSRIGGITNALALFSMLAAVPQTPDKIEQHTSIINAGDQNSAKLTVVGKTQSGIPLEPDELPIAKIGIPGKPLVQDNLPAVDHVPGIPLEQDNKPEFTGGVPGIPLENPELPYKNFGIPGKPLEQPELPIAKIGIPGNPLEQPELPYKNIGVPGQPLVQDDLPAFTGGVPGIPLVNDKPTIDQAPGIPLEQSDKPIAEIGIPGKPLEQPDKPIAKIGIPGEPLEQPDKPIAEIGIPGEPLEQPDRPIAEIGIPGEPLEQPDKPIAPFPDTNIPDIPNTEKPEKQVPQKPTPSNPTPDPEPTPEIPIPDEYAPVKSGNITSDSFVSARTNPTKVVPKKYRNTEKLLPQTGKKNSVALSVLGLATLSLTGLMGLAITKKKRC